ncbi:MAG TPA: DUF6790 family protein [Polyangia bacterium]|jgi:hypothetical protein
MLFILIALVVVVSVLHVIVSRQPRTLPAVLGVVLQYYLLLLVGVSGVFAFTGHAFKADDVARRIGWPTGNPFQAEVAAANLAIGVLGIASVWFKDGFRLAAALAYSVFMIGAGLVHLQQQSLGNHAELNSGGMILVTDLVMPVVLLALVLAQKRLAPARA